MREPLLPVDQRLLEHPYEFDFFQAVRLLHLMLNDRPGVGRIARPSEEPVRFKIRQSLEFPASSIHSLSDEADPPRLTVAFMGLTGVQGVLPHHYTVHILDRGIYKDFAMAEFFDLFNHRILSLFYRAWEKHHFPVRLQLAAARGETDHFTEYLFDWIGLGTARLRKRMALPDQALLRYAGLLGQSPACAISLQAILRDYFEVSVEIEQLVGAWYSLKEEDQCELGAQSPNNQLGEGAIAGDAVWDPQARFRVRLGPLKLVKFLAFLPDSPAVKELGDLVWFYVGPVIQFDVQTVLKADEVPWSRLGDESPAGPRLGWCAWLKTEEFGWDAADAVFPVN
jgi:type VI secretion system protein ImpH